MSKTIDYPAIIISGNGDHENEFTVSFPDVAGSVGVSNDEDIAIQHAKFSVETILNESGTIPTPSDLTFVAREHPQKTIRLITVDLNENYDQCELVGKA